MRLSLSIDEALRLVVERFSKPAAQPRMMVIA
jgi:hypothetical protein